MNKAMNYGLVRRFDLTQTMQPVFMGCVINL